MTKRKAKRGGARRGAGRPSKYGPTVSTTLRLPVEIRLFLESDSAGPGSMADRLIRVFVRTGAFRAFQKSRRD